MASMVERIARAICRESGIDPDKPMGADDGGWVRSWVECADFARIALDEISAPTDGMIKAMSTWTDGPHSAIRALVDAALDESGLAEFNARMTDDQARKWPR